MHNRSKLKGGIPLNGTYSGTGVSGSTFFPVTAGGGNFYHQLWVHQYLRLQQQCHTDHNRISPLSFTCENSLTDPRDNQTYPTIQIGTQCWMAANLNYGVTNPGMTNQRDNCTPEKYCYQDNPSNCISSGGLYQWDEIMQYDDAPGSKGLCPPAWHYTGWNRVEYTVFILHLQRFCGKSVKIFRVFRVQCHFSPGSVDLNLPGYSIISPWWSGPQRVMAQAKPGHTE